MAHRFAHPSQRTRLNQQLDHELRSRIQGWKSSPVARATVAYLEAITSRIEPGDTKERLEAIAWNIESNAQNGFDLHHDQALEVLATVHRLLNPQKEN